MNNIYKKITNKTDNIDAVDAFNLVMRDSETFSSLSDNFKKSPEFISNVLFHSPQFFNTASKSSIEKDAELLKKIITEPIKSLENHSFETLSLAHEKIKTRDFCLEMIKINPYNIKHVPHKFLYDSEFIEAALQLDGATVQYMPTFVKQNEKFGLMAVQNNGFSLKFFSTSIINSREILLTALNTKGFSLSQFDNPEIMCHDNEIAEKALKADPKAIQFFDKNNPLLKDKYFAIKMIPFNAKFFALFDQEIRHDPDTLLQIVKGKSVEQIMYIVSQEFTLYPKFFLFALDEYQKCLTDIEKETNFGFYYYLHTSLFKERQKKFNIAYRRNLERKKAISQQEEQKELERRQQAQAHISKTSELSPDNNSDLDSDNIPNLFKKESIVITETSKPIDETTSPNHTANRLGEQYQIQSSKDFTSLDNINNSMQESQIETNEDIDNYSHLIDLADDLNESNSRNNNLSNIDNDTNNNLTNNNLTVSPKHDNAAITDSSFMDFQSYTSKQVKKANSELNEINVLPIDFPKNNQIVPDVTRFNENINRLEQEPHIETVVNDLDMSPAQNAAKRAFGNRTRSITPDAKEENDYIHKPIKRETTKKGSMSIFNFQKDKESKS